MMNTEDKGPFCSNCCYFGKRLNACVSFCNLHNYHTDQMMTCDKFDRREAKVDVPPLGIEPKYIHDERRFANLAESVSRYAAAGLKVPIEWVEEMALLICRRDQT